MYKYSKGFLPMNHQLNQDPIETVYKGYYSCPFFPLYGVNKEGDVIFLPTGKKEVYRKYSSHKEPVVIIKTNSGTKTVYRPRMIALTFIPVPKELKGKTLIEVNYKDGNEENLSLDNLEWAERGTWAKMRKWFENKRLRDKWEVPEFNEDNPGTYPNAVECKFKPGFFYLPNVERPLVCNNKGDVYDLELKEYIKHRPTQFGYIDVLIRVSDYNNKKEWFKNYKVHRLVASLFCPKPGNKDWYDVNHKDGDKTNNYYTNLEWVTPRENALHAIQTGLVPVRWVMSRNIQTGEIKRFSSAYECGKYFGISDTVLLKRLNRGTAATITYNWHVFMYEDQGPYWPELTEEQKVQDRWMYDYVHISKATPFKVRATNLKSKKSIIYPSLSSAARNSNTINSTLSFYFKSYGDVVELNGYRFEKLGSSELSSQQIKAWSNKSKKVKLSI